MIINTHILAFSGRKGSGKNTAANYVVGEILRTAHVIHSGFTIAPTGELLVNDIFGNTDAAGVLDITNPQSYEIRQFLEREIYPFVKLYSFADLLKKEVCMKILGLSYNQCFGNDNDKNSYTKLRWENMPGICCNENLFDSMDTIANNPTDYFTYHEQGPMTAREIMQYFGTLFRTIYNNVWVDAIIRKIQSDMPETAIITDCRFPNEVEGSKDAGGKVVRLTRTPFPNDQHISETALDDNQFDWSKFDVVLDNSDLTIPEQNKEIDGIITTLGMVQAI